MADVEMGKAGVFETLRVVRHMVHALVDVPAAVQVRARDGRGGALVLEIEVAPGDVGKVIGRQGRTARSLRTIASAAARKHGLSCELDILE